MNKNIEMNKIKQILDEEYYNEYVRMMNHSFPFKDTNIVLLLLEVIIFCNASKYLICIADLEFKISDVYFNILAASTSALAEIMLA